MPEQVLSVANSSGLWICATLAIIVVVVQAALFSRLSFKAAAQLDVPAKDCWKGLRTGIISSVGPSLAIFAVVLGTISLVGSPLAWQNTTLIGSIATDLVGANGGATAVGEELGSANFSVLGLTTAQLAMALNGAGFMIVTLLLATRLEKVRQKAGGGDPKWIGVLGTAAMSAVFAFQVVPHTMRGSGPVAAIIGAGCAMAVLMHLARRVAWLKEYALGFAMISGILAGVIFGQ